MEKWSYNNICLSIDASKICKRFFTPVEMTIIKYPQTISAGEGLLKREPYYTFSGNVDWYSHYGEQYAYSLKKKKPKNIATL